MKEFRYEGERLREISFPVGGIGAGCIGLAGNGALVDWEIHGHPDKGARNSMTHFAVKAESGGELLDARVLQGDYTGRLSGDYEGNVYKWHGFGYGAPSASMAGYPHFSRCAFTGAFPAARVEFSDPGFPGEVALEAFSSFAPLRTDDSSMPCAFFELRFRNTSEREVVYTAAFTLGSMEQDAASFSRGDGACVFGFLSAKGGLCAATDAGDVHVQKAWYRSEWFEAATLYWRDFARVGFMPDRAYEPSGGERGTIEARVSAKPGECASVRFAVGWYYPVMRNDWSPKKPGETDADRTWRHWYASRWPSAEAVVREGLARWEELRGRTYGFRDALYGCSMPDEAVDAAGANLSVLVTPVCLRLEDGSFYAWEGANEKGGSCEGSCMHVWAYAYALPQLFPDLERSVRELEQKYSQYPDGRIAFRLKLPPGREKGWALPCVDGQFSHVFKVYHNYLLTGDRAWLKKMWPGVKKAVEFAWEDGCVRWDPDRSGVLRGRQHHTLDRELFGPSSWLEGMYLAALDAAARMADVLGEDASEYRRVYEKGARYLNGELFNGEYYAQKIDLKDRSLIEGYPNIPDSDYPYAPEKPAEENYWSGEYGEIIWQIGEGCLLDQALAQWHMDLIGLSHPFDGEKLRRALKSLFANNFKESMRDTFNPCRVFCLDGESGTMICTYPEGHAMPAIPIPYCQEVMTGFEYAFAGLLLMEGMADEARRVIAAVRSRYRGNNRNPWNEIECGNNYARSMASFALTNAYAGLTCDMDRGVLSFSPVKGSGAFRGVWFTGDAWGTAEEDEEGFTLRVLDGELKLASIRVRDLTPRAAMADGEERAFRVCEGGETAFGGKMPVRRSLVLKK